MEHRDSISFVYKHSNKNIESINDLTSDVVKMCQQLSIGFKEFNKEVNNLTQRIISSMTF